MSDESDETEEDGDPGQLPPEMGESARADQMSTNFHWLMDRVRSIHSVLCPGKTGTWQMIAEQTVVEAERLAWKPSSKLPGVEDSSTSTATIPILLWMPDYYEVPVMGRYVATVGEYYVIGSNSDVTDKVVSWRPWPTKPQT